MRANKLRTLLTALGNVVAVGALVTVLALVEGVNQDVSRAILARGADVFYVERFGPVTSDAGWKEAMRRPPIRPDDARAIREGTRLAGWVLASFGRSATVEVLRAAADSVRVEARTADYPQFLEEDLAEGRHFTEAEDRLRASDENDFELLTQESVLALWRKVSRTIFLGLVGISSVALLVSGIGVLAVMTVAVSERTREVRVRRAVGVRRRHILLQFLLEAAMLTGAGGVLGSALGAAAAHGIGRAIELPVSTPPLTFALALGVSTLVGLLFGVVPAWRAARLDPVEALRYE